mmetsp:Transcript_36131/g.65513  ORF Transcript_36131/g.65513 Transcript_36131/m.65513 type:complete len:633 (+) Transcript_36131:145-2043(+)
MQLFDQVLLSIVASLLFESLLAEAKPVCATPGQAVSPALLQITQQQSRTGGVELEQVNTFLGEVVKDSTLLAATREIDRLDPSFFDSFAEGESTFNIDGEGFQGKNLNENFGTPSMSSSILTMEPPRWYHETESAGSEEAWQTFGPNSKDVHPYSPAPAWIERPDGRVDQDWYPSDPTLLTDALFPVSGKDAAWFDVQADQYDGFGRPRLPSDLSDKYYAEWKELKRSVNLTCADPGCTANQTLQVFDNLSVEEYKMCRLSVMLRATDFDDEYSRETVEWLTVNDKEVLRNFTPRAKGCGNLPSNVITSLLETGQGVSQSPNSTTNGSNTSSASVGFSTSTEPPVSTTSAFNLSSTDSASNTSTSALVNASSSSGNSLVGASFLVGDSPLYGFLTDFDVQELLGSNGSLKIAGKISKYVDECPVDGKHFSAVAVVTCFHRPILILPTTTTTTTTTLAPAELAINISRPVLCKAPGCTANVFMTLPERNKDNRTCKLTVRINNTDFDGIGAVETVEWLQLNGDNETISSMISGTNPCQLAQVQTEIVSNHTSEAANVSWDSNTTWIEYANATLPNVTVKSTLIRDSFTLLDQKDVTATVAGGNLTLSVKISEMVDECAIDGYLLYGIAELVCI